MPLGHLLVCSENSTHNYRRGKTMIFVKLVSLQGFLVVDF